MAADGWTRVAAYCVVEDAEGRILLCRLSIDELEHAKWTLPGGGLDFGEDPQAAAIRELEEETGLHGTVAALLGIDSRVYRPNATRPEPLHGIRIVYRVDAEDGEVRHELTGRRPSGMVHARAQAVPLVVDLVPISLAMLDRTRPVRNA